MLLYTFVSDFAYKSSLLITVIKLVNRMERAKEKYSVIMPTYQERENLPVIVFLLMEVADSQ